MSRTAALIFAIFCYAIVFATFLYLIVFVGDFQLGTVTVDQGPLAPPAAAAAIDVGLIALFGLQHSIMARQGFKRWWTQFIRPPIERSVYVLSASVALMILFRFWRPINAIVWNVTNPILHDLVWLLFWAGWLTALLSTFLISHFEMFGLQQAWLHIRRRDAVPPRFRQPLLYKYVRHPLYLGFFLAFWAAPEMTAGHLLFAAGMLIYILIAIRYEEKDLVGRFGRDYERYREHAGMLIPKIRREGGNPAA